MVKTTPVEIDGHPLLVCSLRDIAAEKRREVLERVFLHNLTDTAGGIRGLAELLFTGGGFDPAEEHKFKKMMVDLSESLVEEIKQQRELLTAESGNFEPYLEKVFISSLMHKLFALHVNHDCAKDRILVLETVPGGTIVTDRRIIQRILGNLIKNALEATPAGGRVTFSCRETGDTVTFIILNPGVMPDEVKLQIFQRSFSTRAASGRGIGTYSAKLFGERYLKGKVAFTSREQEGTVFTVTVTKSGEPLGENGQNLSQ
jgi:hypothetical protein